MFKQIVRLASRMYSRSSRVTSRAHLYPVLPTRKKTTRTERSQIPKLNLDLDLHLQAIKKAIDLSSNLEVQKALFSPKLIAPKSLETGGGSVWASFYFNDFRSNEPGSDAPKMQQVLRELQNVIASSAIGDAQNRKLVTIIQASGYGKSHLAYQYCLQNRAILLRFLEHEQFLSQLLAFIDCLRKDLKIPRGEVADQTSEITFSRTAYQATALIPMTFIQFAKLFFDKYASHFKEENLNEAFLRTILAAGPKLYILEMYKDNLALYAHDTTAFLAFSNLMNSYAKEIGLKAVLYDEVLQFYTEEGQFLHHPWETMASYKQLALERKLGTKNPSANTSHLTDSQSYHQNTSLLYLMRVAMEEFVKAASLPQVVLATHFATRQLDLPKRGVPPRGRLKIVKFYWTEEPNERWKRFTSELTSTFAPTPEFVQKVEELRPFAVRPAYLWGFWQTLSVELCQNRNLALESVMDKAIDKQKLQVQALANEYVERMMDAGNIEWQNEFLARIAVGHTTIAATHQDLQLLLETGLIPLPVGAEGLMRNLENDPQQNILVPLTDEFISSRLESMIDFEELLLYFAPSQNKRFAAGQFGELLAFALLKQHKGKSLNELALGGDKSVLNNEVLQKFMISDCRLLSFREYFNKLQQPTTSFQQGFTIVSKRVLKDEQTFLTGLKSTTSITAIVCIQTNFSEAVVDPKTAKVALESLDPNNFFSGTTELLSRCRSAANEINQPHYWIRILSGWQFSKSVCKAVTAHNLAHPQQPIMLLTPELFNKQSPLAALQSMKPTKPAAPKTKTKMALTQLLLTKKCFASTILTPEDEKSRRIITKDEPNCECENF